MLEHAAIIALLVLSIWYTYQEGEIFGFVQRWSNWKIAPALFECNVCMSPYYGSALYWLIPWEQLRLPAATHIGWPIVVITAMGINAALNKLTPDKGAPNLTENKMNNIIEIGFNNKGEADFAISGNLCNISLDQMNDLRKMIIVGIGVAEDMFRRAREKTVQTGTDNKELNHG